MLFCGNAFSQSEPSYPEYDSLKREYQILAIKKINRFYLISAIDDNNYRFTIVSKKYREQGGNVKIEVGKKYELLCYSVYPIPEDDVILVGGNMIHHDFFIDGTRIKFQGDFDTGILITSPNLNGLYYLKFE